MTAYTLNGQAFDVLGVENVIINKANMGTDVMSFTLKEGYGDADEFAIDSTVVLKGDNGDTCFAGKVTCTPSFATGSTNGRRYEVSGPWCYLERNIYQQKYRVVQDPDDPTGLGTYTYWKSRVVLGEDEAGNALTTGNQIAQIINFGINDVGLPILLGSGFVGFLAPLVEEVDITIAEAIRSMMRWHPDATVWFDYSTSPPTINFTKRSALPKLQFSHEGKPISEVNIKSRSDLVPNCVVIHWETYNDYDGTLRQEVVTDKAPASASETDDKCIVVTLPFQGLKLTKLRQRLETRAIPPNGNSSLIPSFLSDHETWMNDAGFGGLSNFRICDDGAGNNIWNLEILDPDGYITAQGQSLNPADYPRELLLGQVTDWMTGIKAAPMAIETCLEYVGPDSDIARQYFGDDLSLKCPIRFQITATDGTDKEYCGIDGYDMAIPPPMGLAADYYESINTLQWEGYIKLCEEEVRCLNLGHTVCITGGQAKWASMNALVQRTSENLGTGETTLYFGPANHLGPQDLLSLMAVLRGKLITFRSSDVRDNGEIDPPGGTIPGTGEKPRLSLEKTGAGAGTVSGNPLSIQCVPNPDPNIAAEAVCVIPGTIGGIYPTIGGVALDANPKPVLAPPAAGQYRVWHKVTYEPGVSGFDDGNGGTIYEMAGIDSHTVETTLETAATALPADICPEIDEESGTITKAGCQWWLGGTVTFDADGNCTVDSSPLQSSIALQFCPPCSLLSNRT